MTALKLVRVFEVSSGLSEVGDYWKPLTLHSRYKYLAFRDAFLLQQNFFSFLVDLAVSEPGERSLSLQRRVNYLTLLSVLPWSTH